MKIKDAQKLKILRSKATEKSYGISGTLGKGSGTTNVVSGTNYVGFQALIFPRGKN